MIVFKFILSWHWFDRRSVDFFLLYVSTSFQNENINGDFAASFIILMITLISYCCLLAQLKKALKWLYSSLLCLDTGLIGGPLIFFLLYVSTSFQNKNIY